MFFITAKGLPEFPQAESQSRPGTATVMSTKLEEKPG
jgi:hypothetical protein